MNAYIEDIARHEGQPVTLRGWLHNRRSSGKIHFLTVRDGTGFIQCVMSKQAVGEDLFRAADHLAQESAIVVHGSARARLFEDAFAPWQQGQRVGSGHYPFARKVGHVWLIALNSAKPNFLAWSRIRLAPSALPMLQKTELTEYWSAVARSIRPNGRLVSKLLTRFPYAMQ